MMLYNNVLSLPVVLLMSLSLGELEGLAKFPYLYDPGFLFCFFFSSSLAFILNYSIFLCTTLNSALTTSVTGAPAPVTALAQPARCAPLRRPPPSRGACAGQIKNVATTVVGLFLFGDVQFHPLNIVGLALGVLGRWGVRAQPLSSAPPLTSRAAGPTVSCIRTSSSRK